MVWHIHLFQKSHSKMAPASAVEDEQPNKRQRLNSTNGDSDRNIQVISIRTVYIRIFLHEPQVSYNEKSNLKLQEKMLISNSFISIS